MSKSRGVSYFPFYFEFLPTIEDLEADGFKISIFLRAICKYASQFQRYENALDEDSNPIPPSVSGTARQAFRTFKAKIDPRLNAMKNQGLNSAANGSGGGRPRSFKEYLDEEVALQDSAPVKPRKTRTGSKKPEQVKQVMKNLNRFPEPEQVSEDSDAPVYTGEKPEQVIDNQNRFSKPEQVKQVSKNLNRDNRKEKKRSEDIALSNVSNSITGIKGSPDFASPSQDFDFPMDIDEESPHLDSESLAEAADVPF
jgi:hypothetical protein